MSFIRTPSLYQNSAADSKFLQTRISNLEAEYKKEISSAHAQVLAIPDQTCRDNLLDCFNENNYIPPEQINNLRKEVAWYLRKTSCCENTKIGAAIICAALLIVAMFASKSPIMCHRGTFDGCNCCDSQQNLIDQLKITKTTVESAFALSERIMFLKRELNENNNVASTHLKRD